MTVMLPIPICRSPKLFFVVRGFHSRHRLTDVVDPSHAVVGPHHPRGTRMLVHELANPSSLELRAIGFIGGLFRSWYGYRIALCHRTKCGQQALIHHAPKIRDHPFGFGSTGLVERNRFDSIQRHNDRRNWTRSRNSHDRVRLDRLQLPRFKRGDDLVPHASWDDHVPHLLTQHQPKRRLPFARLIERVTDLQDDGIERQHRDHRGHRPLQPRAPGLVVAGRGRPPHVQPVGEETHVA